MSGKHTPGPWVVLPFGEGIGPGVVTLGDDGACNDPECCGGPTFHVEISEADAKLIAQAPAMADLLDVFLRVHGEEKDDPCGCRACLRADVVLRLAGRKP